jgi:hypothetical protein
MDIFHSPDFYFHKIIDKICRLVYRIDFSNTELNLKIQIF